MKASMAADKTDTPRPAPGVLGPFSGAPNVDDRLHWDECAVGPDRCTTEIGFMQEDRVVELFVMNQAIRLHYEEFGSQSGAAALASVARWPMMPTEIGGTGEVADEGSVKEPIHLPTTPQATASETTSSTVDLSKNEKYWVTIRQCVDNLQL